MDSKARARLVKAAALGLLLGACDSPPRAKTPTPEQDGGATREGVDHSGGGDKAHCGGHGD
jgi:hypothetical protein